MMEKNDTNNKFRNDWLPTMMMGMLMFTASLIFFYLPAYLKETLGFSGTQIGLIVSSQAIGGTLAVLPAGIGNDRITSRTWISLSLLFLGAAFFLMGKVTTFWTFLGAYFLWNLNNHLFRMSVDVQVLKTDDGLHTGGRIGLYQGMRFFGIGVGTILAGYLIQYYDYSHALIVAALACLTLIPLSRMLPPTQVSPIKLSDYKADFFNGRMALAALWLVIFASHWGAEHTCYILFLKQDLGLSMIQCGWYMSGEFAAVLFTATLVGRRLQGTAWMPKVAIIALLLSGIGHIGMVFQPIWLSFAFRTLHGVGDGLVFLIFYVGIAKLFNVKRMGGNAGLLNLSTMLGLIIGALTYSTMGEKIGYATPLWISGVIIIALAFPVLFLSRKRKPVQ